MTNEPWLYYNQEDDCYYSADGKICGAEVAAAKMDWPPRSSLSEGIETRWGRNAIRKLIREINQQSRRIK
jgi:hypothetical protein